MNHNINLVLKSGQFKTTPLVFDAGASFQLIPFHSNFIDYVELIIDVKDIFKFNKVVGFGTTLHKFTATNGDLLCAPAVSYHLPSADIWLFGP